MTVTDICPWDQVAKGGRGLKKEGKKEIWVHGLGAGEWSSLQPT